NHILDEVAGSTYVGLVRADQLIAKTLYHCAEGNDVEAVAGVDVFQTVVDGRASLLHLLAAHRTAGIQYEQDVLLDDLLDARAGGGAEQHEEAVLLAAAAVGQHAQAEVILVGDPEEAELIEPGPVIGAHAGRRLRQSLAGDRGIVRRAEDAAERFLRAEVDG